MSAFSVVSLRPMMATSLVSGALYLLVCSFFGFLIWMSGFVIFHFVRVLGFKLFGFLQKYFWVLGFGFGDFVYFLNLFYLFWDFLNFPKIFFSVKKMEKRTVKFENITSQSGSPLPITNKNTNPNTDAETNTNAITETYTNTCTDTNTITHTHF